jgi:tRNA-specific adenosine deaminase 1
MLTWRDHRESAFIKRSPCSSTSNDNSLEERAIAPFYLCSSLSIHLFSSEPPCGDASMELLMAKLGPEASQPWTVQHSSQAGGDASSPSTILQGRTFFSSLGIMRRKPSRPDAEPTLSKSCTDKLAIKQLTSLLSFPANQFIAPTRNAYLSSLIVPAAKYEKVGYTRAFGQSGRLSPLPKIQLSTPFHPFEVLPLHRLHQPQFPFSKPTKLVRANSDSSSEQISEPRACKASNLSAVYIYHSYGSVQNSNGTVINETLINGVKQGQTINSPSSLRKASAISRANMLRLGRSIASLLLRDHPSTDLVLAANLQHLLDAQTYAEAKQATATTTTLRSRAKQILARVLSDVDASATPGTTAWPKNTGDDDWPPSPMDQ